VLQQGLALGRIDFASVLTYETEAAADDDVAAGKEWWKGWNRICFHLRCAFLCRAVACRAMPVGLC